MAKRKKTAKARAKSARRPAAKRSAKKPARAAAKKTAPAGPYTSHAASLTVNDVAQSLAWYTDVLGFKIKQRWERPEGNLVGAELGSGALRVYIGQDDWAKGRDRVKGEGFRLYWYTNKNIDRIADDIKKRGGTLASEPKEEWGMRYFTIEDPTGYKITIGSER